jgi:hypothetical protein
MIGIRVALWAKEIIIRTVVPMVRTDGFREGLPRLRTQLDPPFLCMTVVRKVNRLGGDRFLRFQVLCPLVGRHAHQRGEHPSVKFHEFRVRQGAKGDTFKLWESHDQRMVEDAWIRTKDSQRTAR